MNLFEDFSKGERRIIIVSSISILLVTLLFWKGEDWIWGEDSVVVSAQEEIGSLTVQENDVRHRSQVARVWYKAKERQTVHNGDAIFSGKKSRSQVQLKTGGSIDLGENSLVVFDILDKKKVADLRHGSFNLKVDGTIKIAIQGKMTTIEGKKSVVEIALGKDQKPKLKLISGEAKIKQRNRPQLKLVENVEANLPAAEPGKMALEEDEKESGAEPVATIVAPEPDSIPVSEPEATPADLPVTASTPTSPTPIPMPREIAILQHQEQELHYVWELYDLYEKQDAQLAPKANPPMMIEFKKTLAWTLSNLQKVKVQISKTADFHEKKIYDAENGNLHLQEAFVGDNFWRVGINDPDWSSPDKFNVMAEFLKGAEPVVKTSGEEAPLVGSAVSVGVQLKANVETIGFVAQASTSLKFEVESTRTFWSPKSAFNLSFYHAGEYFYRFRSVTKEQKLSTWSQPARFHIFAPIVPGKYRVHASAINSFGQESRVLPKLFHSRKVEEAKAVTSKKGPERRAAASESSSTLKVEPHQSFSSNNKYKSSQVSVNGFVWAIQSSQQYYQSAAAPVASGLGVHSLFWSGRHGLETALKAGLLGLNSAGSQTSLKDIEARYHYRFYTGFPFKLSRELQISLFGGFEAYRNSGGMMSSQYDLLKFGTSLEFPLGQKWSTGGEFVYGIAADQSNKKEVSGNLNYFFDSLWSFGVGYRVHLFEAGTLGASPAGTLPYREGYTEGFSVLNYHY